MRLLLRALFALDLLTSLHGVILLSNNDLCPSVEDSATSSEVPELVWMMSSPTGPALLEETATGLREGVTAKISSQLLEEWARLFIVARHLL